MNRKEKLLEATIEALTDNKLDNFNAFLKKYKFEIDSHLKFKNNKFYRKINSQWSLSSSAPKIVKNIGPYKIAAQHFNVNVPYTNYYIIDTQNNTVYTGYSGYSYLSNNLKELVDDLNKVINGSFNEPKSSKENDFDPLANI